MPIITDNTTSKQYDTENMIKKKYLVCAQLINSQLSAPQKKISRGKME